MDPFQFDYMYPFPALIFRVETAWATMLQVGYRAVVMATSSAGLSEVLTTETYTCINQFKEANYFLHVFYGRV